MHAGLPYATLREIHAGRTQHPGHCTLERLARVYGVPLQWFIDGSSLDDGTLPLAGWVGFVSTGARSERRVRIPWAAWPLIRVLVMLEQRLRELPASPDRPIIGALSDPRAIRDRLTAFVLQPLLAARGVPWGPTDVAWGEPGGAAGARWIGMLSDLGRFWERALVGLFPDLVLDGAPPST